MPIKSNLHILIAKEKKFRKMSIMELSRITGISRDSIKAIADDTVRSPDLEKVNCLMNALNKGKRPDEMLTLNDMYIYKYDKRIKYTKKMKKGKGRKG